LLSVAGSTPPRGLVQREGARVLLLSADGKLLVLRGHDPHLPSRTWWFTPGGGIEGSETVREAASRELAEETGYVVAPAELIGPVWERTAYFDFKSRPYVQHEYFFVARLTEADVVPLGSSAWTTDEQETLDEIVWLTHHDLKHASIEVFPAQLRGSWDEFTRWDGVIINLGEAYE
jgi:8-oxo-dGTP pyrophosphatase MutT (NUDIX family)